VQPQVTRAYSFFKLATAGACAQSLLVFLACLPFYWLFGRWENQAPIESEEVLVFGLSLVGATLATILTTMLATALVLGIFCPHFDGKRHLKPWLSISSYASAHYLLAPLGLPIFIFLVWWSHEMFGPGLVFGFFMVGLACGLLNAFTLTAVVLHRGAKSSGRSWAILAIFGIYALLTLIVPIVVVSTAMFLFAIFGR